jgi:hypothetical protein
MAGQQRKCANCRFFTDAGLAGNGWCTHPRRQLNSGVKILVRAGELACRNSWGGDLFQHKLDTAAEPAANADLPGDGQDEVTSVTMPSARPHVDEDRVVSDRPAPRRDLHDPNDAAQRDQEERARVIARGNRDALMQARQRYSTRRQGNQPVVDDDNMQDDLPGQRQERVVARQERYSDRYVSPGGARPSPRTEPVPREEISRRLHGQPGQDRFETVPEVDPSFDLPGQFTTEPIEDIAPPPVMEPQPVAADDELEDEVQVTSYEHVLQRARRIRQTKQQRSRPLRHADLRIEREPVEDEGWEAAPGYDEPIDDENRLDGFDVEYAQAAPVAASLAQFEDDRDFAAAEPLDDEALGWDDRSVMAHAEPDDDVWEDDDADWEPYDDAPSERRQQRRRWLGRFNFGRRNAVPTHDDADITRHTASADEWDDPVDDDVEDTWLPEWEASYSPDRDDRHEWASAPEAPVMAEEYRGWSDVDFEPPPVPAPERDQGRRVDIYAHENELRSHPEPAAPARPASSGWHRHRQDSMLPDLDDNLFETSFAARPDRHEDVTREPATARRAEAESSSPSRSAAEILQSRSPRDSYFRSSHLREPSAPAPAPDQWQDPPRERVAASRSLPDLDTGDLDVREVATRGGELLDMTIDIAPDLPRECRTCRSFRSADGGVRGWCTNEWAFTHRRMVNEDDLACETSIGCWWLPHDRYRQSADDENIAAQTPRMDELLARILRPAERVEHKVAGE